MLFSSLHFYQLEIEFENTYITQLFPWNQFYWIE